MGEKGLGSIVSTLLVVEDNFNKGKDILGYKCEAITFFHPGAITVEICPSIETSMEAGGTK